MLTGQRSGYIVPPTPLSHDSLLKILTPGNSSAAESGDDPNPSIPCPLERFLGSVLLKRHLTKVLSSDVHTKVSEILIMWFVKHMSFQIFWALRYQQLFPGCSIGPIRLVCKIVLSVGASLRKSLFFPSLSWIVFLLSGQCFCDVPVMSQACPQVSTYSLCCLSHYLFRTEGFRKVGMLEWFQILRPHSQKKYSTHKSYEKLVMLRWVVYLWKMADIFVC